MTDKGSCKGNVVVITVLHMKELKDQKPLMVVVPGVGQMIAGAGKK